VRAAAAVLALSVIVAPPAAASADGGALFARCAACHLATDEGVPGAFPPMREQIARDARSPAGRDYLVSVVSHGLAGPLIVEGKPYMGFMPAQGLTDDEAAAVLNYVVGAIAGAKPPAKAFTASEVAAIRARRQNATAQDDLSLRPGGGQ
jgi:mono/diheme cytochrome c family protein